MLQRYIKKFRTLSISYLEFKEHYISEVKAFFKEKAEDLLNQIDWDAWITKPGQMPKANDFSKI
jgi:hypothetical protein